MKKRSLKKYLCLILTIILLITPFASVSTAYAFDSACITFQSPSANANFKVGSNVEVKYTVMDPYSDSNIQAFVVLNFYADGKKYADKNMGFVPKGSAVTGGVTLEKMGAGKAKVELVCLPYNLKTASLDTSIPESNYPSKSVSFTVGASNKISDCTCKLSSTKYTYDGKSKKPSVTVKKGSTTLKNGTDYTVTYASGRKNVGKYSVTIKGKGKYTGSKTLTFKINPKGTSVSSMSAASKAFTVKWKKQATQTTGYQIQYSTSSKFSSPKTVTVSKNSTTSKKITKLKAKKKYYVRVRTYKTVSGTKYYSGWSGAKTVTTKK